MSSSNILAGIKIVGHIGFFSDSIIKTLEKDGKASCNPKGNSMVPIIYSGDKVNLTACDVSKVKKGDIVLCKVKGKYYLHLVKAVAKGKVLIGNNKGHINGWTRKVYGKKV